MTLDLQDYSPGAEFYDLVARRHTEALAGVLAEALAVVPAGADAAADADDDADPGTVVELGAGTGRVTRLLAHLVPRAPILAAEPSPVMRAVLRSRVHEDPDLRRRVTIRPETAQELALPERIRAVVLIGVAGHLGSDARADLWRRCLERLVPGGVIVVDLMGTSARSLPATRLLRERIGTQAYEWWTTAEPGRDGATRFTTRWLVLDGARTVREVRGGYEWHSLDQATLAREAGRSWTVLRGGAEGAATEVAVLGR
ncbi:class I SAM-dependent methyltransferase [Clavibacter michiganensis]|uniref:class I SAM-dependent methyltransferase n=2 Tax=Clavibacter michiganensis TaxID=28447 RepID=UPI0009A80789|nr:class I SAM-dependent methyltransferase [Clavibacter michiganensis]MBF4637827.1 class I SAM-dependent methyltransferase [Clavibacter michiganensis subsp. michiganensis]MDO4029094.1 class I SAM-dependent methyltransferase [Clavibacter michiganensis]MDO4066396.1 class I SAM-dependent methyltransferase [Clavibacter michiganensis]MDO4072693.1 class I SAM-dependent methyltransferase [Clavibacter michiganensis]MDO4090824.1 class I SAM-dependent methyltransferase [Clavibacter michiganensis]